jgi:hypothetical protein
MTGEMDLSKITLDTLAGGAIGEMFDHEMVKLLENVCDLNTHEKAREISNVAVKTKLAGLKSVGQSAFIGSERNKLVAWARNPNQEEMFDAHGRAKVTSIDQETDEGGTR